MRRVKRCATVGLTALAHFILPSGSHGFGSKPVARESIAANFSVVNPQGQVEGCFPGSYFQPWIGSADQTGRLKEEFRRAALRALPWENLKEATLAFALSQNQLGRGLSDLSVSGARSYVRFKQLHSQGVLNEDEILRALVVSEGALGRARLPLSMTEGRLRESARKALDRAYHAAHVIYSGFALDRSRLGYIAVSAEDDAPSRPVNARGTAYPQYDLPLRVQGHEFRVRYTIADTTQNLVPEAPWNGARELPGDAPLFPLAPDARVLLYLHGMDSRLEEAEDLIRAFRRISQETGEHWVLIGLDLPNSGYSDYLDPSLIAPVEEVGYAEGFPDFFNARSRQQVPVLDFIESSVVAFVDELDIRIGMKDRLAAVIGGSLGGNLTFRLGRRADLPWLKNVASWSPASIWSGMADGADLFKHLAVATAWKRAGGDTAQMIERPGDRAQFFYDSFDSTVDLLFLRIVPAQPDQWWYRYWPCFESAREVARYERQEIYQRNFRLWHWRLALEQLVYSQQKAPDQAVPRYSLNQKRMLLACGVYDEFNYTNICSSTLSVAKKMGQTPGKAILFKETGHSIHNERPEALARALVDFLR